MSKIRPEDNELQPLSAQPEVTGHETSENGAEQFSEQCCDQVKWPVSPQKLTVNACSSPFSTVLDLILACFPIAFLVLAILAIHLNGSQVSQYGEDIIQATRLGPSIFPIVFAAIVGRLMRSYALWRAEHGAPLGLLEQLNGSTSFAGAISSMLALRNATVILIPVLLLWTMSPVGGQSALRMVSQTVSSVSGNVSAAYMNMNSTSYLVGGSAMTDGLTATNAVYTASLLASQGVKQSPRDLWGWPKIPLLRTLTPIESSLNSSNPWRAAPSNGSIVYSSLTGIVLQGVPPDVDAGFPIESSYLDLDCRMVTNDSTDSAIYGIMGENVLAHNATNLFEHRIYFGNADVTESNFFIDTTYNFTTAARNQEMVNLFYGSRTSPDQPVIRAALFNCTISNIHVESWIQCRNLSCTATHMRQSGNDRRPSPYTPWNDVLPTMVSNWVTFYNFLSQFTAATGPIAATASSPTDSYIYGDNFLFSPEQYDRDWSSVDEQDVSTRLTTVINTYWQASLGPFAITRVLPSDPVRHTVPLDEGMAEFNSTFGTTSKNINVYRANIGWVSVFIISTVTLQFCAVASLFLSSLTVAPDILGYVSSMTRENPHIPHPPGGSTLSGLERARLLWDLRVRIMDVQADRNTGYISLANTTTLDMPERRLDRRRHYE